MKIRKKLLMLIVLSAAFLMVAGRANADLLGLSAGTYPDIFINGGFNTTYNVAAGVGTLKIQGVDQKLYYNKPAPYDSMNVDGVVDFELTVLIDAATGAVTGGAMTEEVTSGTCTINGVTYGVGDMLLAGDTMAFGWEDSVDGFPWFDALIKPDMTTSKLIVDGVWPVGNQADPNPIGILGNGDVKTLSWDNTPNWWTTTQTANFVLLKQADKFPTPEPSTILLLGLGLLGIAGITVKRNKG